MFFDIWLSKQSNDCKHIFFNLITTIKTGIVHDGHTPYIVSKAKDFKEKMGYKSNLYLPNKVGKMLNIIVRFEEEIDFRGFECGLLSICDTFWVQTTFDYLSIESENARVGVLGQ